MRQKINYKDLVFFDRFTVQSKSKATGHVILKDKTSDTLLIVKQLTITQEDRYSQILTTIKWQKKLYHEWLLSFVQYYILKSKRKDSEYMLLFYEYQKKTMYAEVASRRKSKTPYSQKQIWEILFSLVCVCSYLQDNKTPVSSLSLHDIAVTQDKNYKLKMPEVRMQKQKVRKDTYYTPQYISSIVEKAQTTNNVSPDTSTVQLNLYKSGVYCLGLCMLQISLLQSCQACLEWKEQSLQIDQNHLNNMLRKLQSRYSTILLRIISDMLQFQEHFRSDFTELKDIIINYMNYLQLDFAQYQKAAEQQERLSLYKKEVRSSISDTIQRASLNDQLQRQQSQEHYQQQQHQHSRQLEQCHFNHNSTFQSSLNFSKLRKQATRSSLHSVMEPSKKLYSLQASALKLTPNPSNFNMYMPSGQAIAKRFFSQLNFSESIEQQRTISIDNEYVSVGMESRSKKKDQNQPYTDETLLECLRKDVKQILHRRQPSERYDIHGKLL